MGDFIWLNKDHGDFKKGSLGYINWFSQGNTAACSLASKPKETHYIPTWKLQRCEFGRMKRRVGHLKEGEHVLIEEKHQQFLRVYDVDKNYSYSFARDFVEDVTNHLEFKVTDVPWMVEVYDNMLEDLELTIQ